jgi:hypothetical protein
VSRGANPDYGPARRARRKKDKSWNANKQYA